MTARERHTSEGPGTALADIPREKATPFPLLSAMFVPPTADLVSGWSDLYCCVPSLQQKHLVELAVSQGLLHECPLPPPCASGTAPTSPTDSLRFQLLSQFAHGKVDTIEPLLPPPVTCLDSELDDVQRAAVAKALHTPDLCLIQGQAGTGKSRVAAEIVTQAAAQGRRVLLLAQSAAAIDRVLEMVAGREQIYALRCLGRDEALDRLPAAAQALTFAERSRVLRQRTLESARRTQLEIEERLRQHCQEQTLWPKLLELCEQHGQRQQELTRLRQAVARLPLDVEQHVQATRTGLPEVAGTNGELHAPAPHREFCKRLAARHQEYQALQTSRAEKRQEFEKQRQQLTERLTEAADRVNVLRPLAEAKQHGQWWNPAWWRATFQGDAVGQYGELRSQLEALRAELEKVEQQQATLHAEEEAVANRLTEELAQLTQQHLTEQQEALNHQVRVAEEKAHTLDLEWRRLTDQLPLEVLRPAEPTPEAVRAAQQRWQQACAQEEEKGRFLHQWMAYVEEFSATLAARLPRLANVVAATVRGLQDDAHFGDPQSDQHFDLLVMDEAHLITEPELLKVARRTGRWILIGEPAWEMPEPPRETPHERPGRGAHPPRHAPARLGRAPGLFRKLWDHLHCDPSQSHYDWYHAGGRLCCRLRPIPPQYAGYVETEAVADRPDVELRIVTPPREMPFLAEVLFPAAISLREAKQYIYQELQELAIRTASRQLLWLDGPDRVVLRLADTSPTTTEEVPLAEGVVERLAAEAPTDAKVVRHLARTVALEFERDKGWTPERAREWVCKNLKWRYLGRTALLEHAHRMTGPLAAVVEKLLYDRSRRTHENGHLSEPHTGMTNIAPVEFISVPAAPDRRDRRRRDDNSNRSGPPAAGAGLELELTPGKTPPDLPDVLRGLPAQGLINYPEAQAVVRKLEELASDPALRQAAQTHRLGASCPAVAVVALYPAQAELIRRLIRQSARLAHGPLPIEVGVPAAFRHRECLVCLVSLTRSQGGRAVSYGDSCDALPLALTRSRQRVILFGDAGQLARRGQWRGALDHFDEAAAALEKRWVEQLLKYVHGQA